MYNKVVDIYCKDPNLLLSAFIEMVESGMNEEEALSHLYAFCPTKRAALYLRSVLPISWNNIFICPETRNSKDPSGSKEIEKYIKWIKTFDMKFDYVIQNPPYNGSLHLDFLEKGLDLLTEKGRMVIIEPATPFINIRKDGGSAKKFNAIKDRLSGHVESVVIENRNKEFGTGLYVPFATTVIDLSKTYNEIEFVCCGEKRMVKSLYDCNLVGDYATIWSILEKVHNFGNMMKSHTTNKKLGNGVWYAKYASMTSGNGGRLCGTTTRMGGFYKDETWFKNNGMEFVSGYFTIAFYSYDNNIQDTPLFKYDNSGKHLTDEVADNVYGTKEELENWRHFIFNNKLPLFINIVLTIHQQNVVKGWLPWLVDKQYTDEEINKLFGFTDDEIALIDRTIKKYERNSPWFKRYMCGPDSASDEEVNNFIKSL